MARDCRHLCITAFRDQGWPVTMTLTGIKYKVTQVQMQLRGRTTINAASSQKRQTICVGSFQRS